jgi:hypothetical protein
VRRKEANDRNSTPKRRWTTALEAQISGRRIVGADVISKTFRANL